MNYRTLLAVHTTDEPLTNLAPVVSLAQTYDAHVDVLIVSALSAVPSMVVSQVPENVWSDSVAEIARKCEERAEDVRGYFSGEGIGVSVDVKAQQITLLDEAIATAAVFCDLVVMRHYVFMISGVASRAIEGALFDAGKPVLVLEQNSFEAPSKPERILIGWDGSREAARAVHHSIPMLRNAAHVQAFAIDESIKDNLSDSLNALNRHLSRHDIKLDTWLERRDGKFVSHAFVDYVNRYSPSLLVMGAYGHSRFREFVFSGTTRAALTHNMHTALLLAH